MRPTSIVNFERLYLTAIALEGLHIALQGAMLVKTPAALAIRLFSVAISLLLVFLAARRGSGVARLLLTVLFLVGLPVVSYIFGPGVPSLSVVITLLQVALQAAALALLFTPSSREWFARGGRQRGPGSG